MGSSRGSSRAVARTGAADTPRPRDSATRPSDRVVVGLVVLIQIGWVAALAYGAYTVLT
jgi:hypothetical protein